jgi:predicted Zn finger-like uncharacterized protein
MSLITCCPACGTMFRVVPDQLKISEGWVRCGHCAEVFDATAHMMEGAPVPPLRQADAPLPQGQAGWQHSAAPEPSPVDIAMAHAPAQASPAAAPDSELRESPLDQPFVFRRSDLADTDDMPSVSPPAAPRSDFGASSSLLQDEADQAEEELHQLSFVRHARRKAFWRRRGVRAGLFLSALLLAALLGLQVAVHDHDRLAAAQPALRPWLERLCQPLACTLGPPRQIEAIVIDGSSFNKLRGEAYRLNFTLRNNAAFPIEAPALELTLTDTQDQAVLRRVLQPGELGAPSATLAAGGEWTASVPLALTPNGQTGRVAGYRLLAFYP